ncbi:PhzF family phenazine biosynthesis protein [Marinomonas balearica]|uniref:PhzF family phenazine biosynthesis protein n=1 Tax=Marinomonas balearica TaxID=491947 RepID=A0A4R6MG84_9GAMM|nr:PhzF family phenazine biosynthesis protein [Marinomonas balearica]TDP00517.1 PhzF family phenazine biosynthesis protein [Marinomonas balearica]
MPDKMVYLVNAFTFQGAGGNPAGVVLNADFMTRQERQRIATKIGVSETAFVSQSDVADFKIEFYTPTDEIDFCGHATVAVFWLMKELGILSDEHYTQETKVGVLEVSVDAQGYVVQEQSKPILKGNVPDIDIERMFGIPHAVLHDNVPPPEIISTGIADVLIQVPNGVLDQIKPNFELIKQFSQENSVIGFHVFEMNPAVEHFTASTRNFAPLFGINEESATGSASGALAAYLFRHYGIDEAKFEQGRVMGSPSEIQTLLDIKSDEIQKVCVKGTASLGKKWSLEGF